MPHNSPVLHILPVETPQQLAHLRAIRRAVFIVEQAVPEELEWEYEDEAHHYIGYVAGQPVACARWRATQHNGQPYAKIERCAVLGSHRGHGYGAAIVKHVMQAIPGSLPQYLHAQQHALAFYRALGFVPEGEPFDEAGIAHISMIYSPSS